MAQKKQVKKGRLTLMVIVLLVFVWGSLGSMMLLVFTPTPQQQVKRQEITQPTNTEKTINFEEELSSAKEKQAEENAVTEESTTNPETGTGTEIIVENIEETNETPVEEVTPIEEATTEPNVEPTPTENGWEVLVWGEAAIGNTPEETKNEEEIGEEELWKLLQWLIE